MARSIDEILAALGEDAEVVKLWSESMADKRVSEGIASYRKKHPGIDDLGPRLEEVEKRIREKDESIHKEKMKNYAYRKCAEAGISVDLLDGYDLTNETAIAKKIEELAAFAATMKIQRANELMAAGYKPGGGSAPPPEPEWLKKLSPAERVAAEAFKKRDL